MILEDVLQTGLDVVFCGTAVGYKSRTANAYYASQGNKFYPVLYQLSFTEKLLTPQQYKELLKYKIGLTDLVKTQSGNDNTLQKEHFDIPEFRKKILNFKPKIVCFNGKAAAAAFLFSNHKKTVRVRYGVLPQKIGETICYAAPSTSGSANGFWDISYWEQLKSLISV